MAIKPDNNLRHELINLLGDWFTLADQAITKRAKGSGGLPQEKRAKPLHVGLALNIKV